MSRKLAVNRASHNKKQQAMQQLEADVSNAASIQERISELSAELKALTQNIEDRMKAANLMEVVASDAIASFETPKGRSTSVINPYGFRKLVSEKEFMEAVTVQVKNAKQYLGEKELRKITTVYPPDKKSPVLKIRTVTGS